MFKCWRSEIDIKQKMVHNEWMMFSDPSKPNWTMEGLHTQSKVEIWIFSLGYYDSLIPSLQAVFASNIFTSSITL